MKQLLLLCAVTLVSCASMGQLPSGSPNPNSTGWSSINWMQVKKGIIVPVSDTIFTPRYPTLVVRVTATDTVIYLGFNKTGKKWFSVASTVAVTSGGGTNLPVNWTLGYPTYDARYSSITHTHAFNTLTNRPTTLAGYGITDAMSQATADNRYSLLTHQHSFIDLLNRPTTLAGYGITDALTLVAADARYAFGNHVHTFASLTNKPTTLSGYGITDGLTRAQADNFYSPLSHVHTFASLTNKPNTISGYGITDAFTQAAADLRYATIAHTHPNYILNTATITINGVTKTLSTSPVFNITTGGTGTGGVDAATVDFKLDSMAHAGIFGFYTENPIAVVSGINGALDTLTILPKSVTNAMIATNAINTAELIDGSVTNSKLAAGSVTNDKISSNAITGSQIASNTITDANLATGYKMGALSSLTTSNKNSLVEAINEVASKTVGGGSGGGGSGIGFTEASTTTTNATPANIVTIPTVSGESGVIEATVVGTSPTGAITGKKVVRYKNSGGTVTFGTVSNTLPIEADAAVSAATWSISATGSNVTIPVTGVAATTINWTGKYVQTRSISTSTYAVENTWKLNFANQYLPPNILSGWSTLPSLSTNSVPTGTTYSSIRDTSNTTGSLGVTVTGGFDADGSGAPPYDQNDLGIFCSHYTYNHYWSWSTTTASIKITGLTVGKYYQIGILGNSETFEGTTEKFSVGTTETSVVTTGGNYGAGTCGTPYITNPALTWLNNIQPQPDGSITITGTKVTGSKGVLNALVLMQTNTAKP